MTDNKVRKLAHEIAGEYFKNKHMDIVGATASSETITIVGFNKSNPEYAEFAKFELISRKRLQSYYLSSENMEVKREYYCCKE